VFGFVIINGLMVLIGFCGLIDDIDDIDGMMEAMDSMNVVVVERSGKS
jgi:hypothetical protein